MGGEKKKGAGNNGVRGDGGGEGGVDWGEEGCEEDETGDVGNHGGAGGGCQGRRRRRRGRKDKIEKRAGNEENKVDGQEGGGVEGALMKVPRGGGDAGDEGELVIDGQGLADNGQILSLYDVCIDDEAFEEVVVCVVIGVVLRGPKGFAPLRAVFHYFRDRS